MANSDVKLKHKVQLRKKVEEPVVAVEAEPGNTPTPDKSSSKTWLWNLLNNPLFLIFFGIIAVIAICYFIFSKSGDTTITVTEQETEVVEETIVHTDSVGKKGVTEDVLPTDENEESINADNQEAKENESPATNSNIAKSTVNHANVSNDVETEAMKVIRGDYGVCQERKDILGTKYQTIQSRVNELKREGIF